MLRYETVKIHITNSNNESSQKRALEKLNFWAYDPMTEWEITLQTSSAAQKAVEYGICPKI